MYIRDATVQVQSCNIYENSALYVSACFLNFPGTFFRRPPRKKLPRTGSLMNDDRARLQCAPHQPHGMFRKLVPHPAGGWWCSCLQRPHCFRPHQHPLQYSSIRCQHCCAFFRQCVCFSRSSYQWYHRQHHTLPSTTAVTTVVAIPYVSHAVSTHQGVNPHLWTER